MSDQQRDSDVGNERAVRAAEIDFRMTGVTVRDNDNQVGSKFVRTLEDDFGNRRSTGSNLIDGHVDTVPTEVKSNIQASLLAMRRIAVGVNHNEANVVGRFEKRSESPTALRASRLAFHPTTM
jgi:hypothetical protein